MHTDPCSFTLYILCKIITVTSIYKQYYQYGSYDINYQLYPYAKKKLCIRILLLFFMAILVKIGGIYIRQHDAKVSVIINDIHHCLFFRKHIRDQN
jgi:hypothetical protein